MHPALQSIFISFVADTPAANAAAVPEHQPHRAAAAPSHAEMLRQLDELIQQTNESCDDSVPLFLQRAANG